MSRLHCRRCDASRPGARSASGPRLRRRRTTVYGSTRSWPACSRISGAPWRRGSRRPTPCASTATRLTPRRAPRPCVRLFIQSLRSRTSSTLGAGRSRWLCCRMKPVVRCPGSPSAPRRPGQRRRPPPLLQRLPLPRPPQPLLRVSGGLPRRPRPPGWLLLPPKPPLPPRPRCKPRWKPHGPRRSRPKLRPYWRRSSRLPAQGLPARPKEGGSLRSRRRTARAIRRRRASRPRSASASRPTVWRSCPIARTRRRTG
mmetsp:Transcript_136290/g.436130  ORF Transcript_136290/g.436130 Transcript_136290/m.436130 type:complete len:256 (+) Transcript_136290:287-1054(+)